MKYIGRIPVEDASGCRFELHEFRAWRLLSPTTVFRLDTGEAVVRVDANTFVITSTGEGLVRVIELV